MSAVFSRDPDVLASRTALHCSQCHAFIPHARIQSSPTCESCDAVLCSAACKTAHDAACAAEEEGLPLEEELAAEPPQAALQPPYSPTASHASPIATARSASPLPGTPQLPLTAGEALAARLSRTINRFLNRRGVATCPRHRRPCVVEAIKRFLRGFLCAYGGRLVWALLMALLRGKRDKLAFQPFGWDTIRFALFLGALAGGNAGLRCLLAHVRGVDDKKGAAAAGAIAGLALLIDSPSRHTSVAVYLLCRAVYSVRSRSWRCCLFMWVILQ